jgi:hypothetical protein
VLLVAEAEASVGWVLGQVLTLMQEASGASLAQWEGSQVAWVLHMLLPLLAQVLLALGLGICGNSSSSNSSSSRLRS